MRILIATGDSPQTDLALRFGSYLAAKPDVHPTVLMVVARDADRAHSERVVAEGLRLVGMDPSRSNIVTRVGHRADAMLSEAEEGRHDLLVLGDARHHWLLKPLMLGSTAMRVLERAACPVVVAKGLVAEPRRVLVCASGAPTVSLLARFVTKLGPMVDRDNEVTVLHVMSQIEAGLGVESEPLTADAEMLIERHTPEGELLQRDVELLRPLGVVTRLLVRHGLVVDEIVHEARAGGHDMVVIGAHIGAGWQRLLLDDIAREVVVRVDRPVLVVR